MIRSDAVATCHDLSDATERPFVVGHLAGSTVLFLNLRYTSHKELRLTRHGAAELALILDHFARHEQLPTSFPREDFHI